MRNGAAISVISVRVSMRVCHSVCASVRQVLSLCVCVWVSVCWFFSVGSGWTARRFRLSTSYGNDDKKWQPQLQLLLLLCALACAKGRQGVRGMKSRRWGQGESERESKCMWVWLSSRARGDATARVQLKFHCTLLQRLLSTSGPQRQAAGSRQQ